METTLKIRRPLPFLLAVDFDGTIAPIVSTPEQAQVHPVAGRFLRTCAAIEGVVVAIVSGRDVEDLRSRFADVRAYIAGSHGLECIDEDGGVLWTAERDLPDIPASLVRRLLRAGAVVERKKFSVAAHFRHMPASPDAELRTLVEWANVSNLDVISGRKVLEVRVRGGGKRAALRAIAGHVGAGRVVYAGDDMTDYPALAFAAAHGRAIFVDNEEQSAPPIAGLRIARTADDVCLAVTHDLLDVFPEAAAGLAAGSLSPDSIRELTARPFADHS